MSVLLISDDKEGLKFLIESSAGPSPGDATLSVEQTGGSSKTPEASAAVIDDMAKIVRLISTRLGQIGKESLEVLDASKGELEIQLGFNTSVSLWVLNAASNNSVTLRFTWNRDEAM